MAVTKCGQQAHPGARPCACARGHALCFVICSAVTVAAMDCNYCNSACAPYFYCADPTKADAGCTNAPGDCDARCTGCSSAIASHQNGSTSTTTFNGHFNSSEHSVCQSSPTGSFDQEQITLPMSSLRQ